ncbi:MAG: hypothetical protein ACLSF7_08635 [Acutalibacteraceae bacterium]|uniref:hypothetical protein n=1 Tax=Candidatus Fimivicinus sp. TaxID=3056640 RepID=UPI002EA29253|nr:hypothetical protein [Acutalibacteraceae bacterium]
MFIKASQAYGQYVDLTRDFRVNYSLTKLLQYTANNGSLSREKLDGKLGRPFLPSVPVLTRRSR